MTFAGRGLSVKTGLLSDGAKIVSVFALLLLCTHSWGACTTFFNEQCGGWNYPGETSNCNIQTGSRCDYYTLETCSNITANISICNSRKFYTILSCVDKYANDGDCGGRHFWRAACNILSCDTQAESDSAYCALNPTADGCVEEDVPPSCQADYQQCVGLGGVWTKTASSATECASLCNTCESSAGVNFRNTQIDICCQQGLAPPDSAVQCSFPAERGPGMTWSTRLTKAYDEGYSCGQLSTASGEAIQENQVLFKRFCLDGDRYEEQSDTNDVGGGSSSSGGEGMSSSEDIGHSFGTELEALGGLYGVLDTIRDTLTKRLTPATEQIRDCLYNFKLCTALEPLQIDWTGMPQDTSMLQIDTAILKHIKPMMDSSVKLDSAQLKVLKQLDSLYKRGLVNDTDIVQAVNAIKGDINDVESAVKRVQHGIDSLIDSMTLYLGRMPSSIVSSIDSAIGEGYGGVDTSGVDFGWLAAGDSLADSIIGGSGYGGLNFAADSLLRDSLEGLGYVCTDSNCCVGSECIEFDSDASIQDSLLRQIGRYSDSVRAQNESFYEDSVKNMFQEVKDSLYRFNPLGMFDSTLMSTLGASIPNSNTCPDHCSTFAVDIPFLFGTQHVVIDWGLCMGRAVLANGNVLSFLRFIIRIIVAVTCITAVMWNAARVRR